MLLSLYVENEKPLKKALEKKAADSSKDDGDKDNHESSKQVKNRIDNSNNKGPANNKKK